MMDWFNTQFYRDFGYGLAYPQIFPHHKRPSDDQQTGTIAWGKERAKGWFQVLNDHWIGPKQAVPVRRRHHRRRLLRILPRSRSARSSAATSAPIRTWTAGWAT